MRIVAPGPALLEELRSEPAGREYPVQTAAGSLVTVATRHEAEVLVNESLVEGVFSARRFKYLRFLGSPRAGMALLRRRLSATARTVSEASQLTIRQNIAGGVVYSHFARRIAAYAPGLRRGVADPAVAVAARALGSGG